MAWVIVVLFFLSGVSSLIGEVVWMRMLGLVLGNTVWAASAVVAVWMGGMAGGAHLGGRLAPRTRRQLRWYGLAEAAIGAFFALSTTLLPLLLKAGAHLGPDLGRHLAVGVAARFALAGLVLGLPTLLMGLTLPLLVERLRGSGLAASVGTLYGVNTLGAVAGVLTAAYVLMPRMGESGSLSTAALICALVAASAVAIEAHVPAAEPLQRITSPGGESRQRTYLLLVGMLGFCALAAELVWVRILVLHLGSRVYAFAVLLGVYLLGIAVGSFVVRALAARITDPRGVLAAVQVGAAVCLVAQLVALGHSGELMAWIVRVAHPPATFGAYQMVVFAFVLLLFLPVTVLFGASFPLAVATDPARRPAGEHVGVVAAADTVGGIIGAVAAPFVLVPLIGSQWVLLLLAAVQLSVAVALNGRWRRRLVWWGVAAAIVIVGVVVPADWVIHRAGSKDESRLVEVKESLASTVLVKRYSHGAKTWLSLELNGVNVAGGSPDLLVIQQLQGLLPLLQVQAPQTVLHVGFGSGGTCWAVSCQPVKRIDVVEISPEVLAAADRYFANINHHVLADPRVHVIINDGRNYLMATDAKYDAILSDSIHPVYAGNGSLYTLEYFRLCRRHLNPGGVASMWLPLYSLDNDSFLRILSAFHQVFPHTVIWHDVTTANEFTIVTGQVEQGPVRIRWSALSDPRLQESLRIAGIRGPADLAMDLLVGPRSFPFLVGEVPPHIDDLPFVEYMSGRDMNRELSWSANLSLLVALRSRSQPFANLPVPWSEVVAGRDPRLHDQMRLARRRATAWR
jgi:spermidine synthase